MCESKHAVEGAFDERSPPDHHKTAHCGSLECGLLALPLTELPDSQVNQVQSLPSGTRLV